MGRGGTGLSSCASAWSGAAVTSKKDRHLIAAGSLPGTALSLTKIGQRLRQRPFHFANDQIVTLISRCTCDAGCPLLARSGRYDRADPCPLLGVKRTFGSRAAMSAFDP